MAYTTDELIQILDQELKAHWKGERVLLSSEDRLNHPVIAKALGAEKLSKVFAYQDFRRQIHEYQCEHGVSGLIWRSHSFGGHIICSPELHTQLIAIPDDKVTLISAKSAILDFWDRATAPLSFWLAGHDPQPTTPDHIQTLIQETEWVEIDAARTELYLSLCWGDPTHCHYQWAQPDSGCIRVIAAMNQPGSIKV